MWILPLSDILWITGNFIYCLMSVCCFLAMHWSTTMVQVEISQQLLGGLKFCTDHGPCGVQSRSPEDETYWLWWLPDFSSRATKRLTFLVFSDFLWIAINLVQTFMHRMNCNHFHDSLTFPVAPSSSQNFNFPNTFGLCTNTKNCKTNNFPFCFRCFFMFRAN